MSKKLQCQDCGQAEYGEDLYNYDGKILCRYCIVARVYEDSTPCEYVGICNDETFPNKTEQIDQLKQQLAEKQNTIDEINKEFVQAVHDWKALCAEKDKEIAHLKEMDNYHLLYELAGADETIANLKKQLEEKEKELAYMTKQAKKFNNEAQKYYEDAYCNSFQNQKAIAELEKVKMMTEWKFNSIIDVVEYIDNQIKELKGEKVV